ncbi:hypothetical protein [Haloferula sargassicola]|uniref:Small terminase subunit n=1 Tax=Haloferula sargassicola TaxID=490096 RepID=A0ABP9ULF1_9BACT
MAGKSRIDAKLKRAPRDQQLELWRLRNPLDPETKPLSLEELQLEVPRICGFTASVNTLWRWEQWFALELEWEEAIEEADQLVERLIKDPAVDPAKAKRAAQLLFTHRAMKQDDGDLFVKLSTLDLKREAQETAQGRLDLDRERFEEMKREVEKKEAAKKSLEERKAAGGLSDEALELIERTLGML